MKSRRGFLGVRFTKHGEAKRRFSLDRVMTKLAVTSQTAIAITFLVMNLSTLLRQFLAFFYIYLKINAFFMIFEFRRLIKIILESNRILIADEFN
jgi:transposase, IS5 family